MATMEKAGASVALAGILLFGGAAVEDIATSLTAEALGCALTVAVAVTAWQGSADALDEPAAGSSGAPPFMVGSGEHVSYASTDVRGDGATELDQSATGVVAEGPVPVTGASGALVISPTFDASITGDVNSAAIQAVINDAINIYESLFNDPLTVSILFRYATTAPDGSALSPGTLAQSSSVVYFIPWNT